MTTFVVTGSSSGLGFQIVKKLLLEGRTVIGIARKLGKASEFDSNEKFRFISTDLASEDKFMNLNPLIEGPDIGDIILILNAAIFDHDLSGTTDMKSARNIFSINYFSSVALVNKFIGHGLKRVLFVNSVAGKIAQLGQAQYSASKHALQAYSESLAKASRSHDFDVMSVNPGGINTELWEQSSLLNRNVTVNFLDPRHLASLICTLLMMPHKTYIQSMIILPEHDV